MKKTVIDVKLAYEVPSTMYVKIVTARFIAASPMGGGTIEDSGSEDDYGWDD